MYNKIIFIDIDDLILDKNNPRLPESFREQDITEKEIINWMLEDASIIELMLAIGQNGFFVGEAILVIENKDGNYTVLEGNRRVSSVKLLSNPKLANIHTRKIDKVLEETTERPQDIPCIIFQKREDIIKYLGYRHVTGIKSWSLLAKARYLSGLATNMDTRPINIISRELAKAIGSKSDYVKRLLVGYKIYEIIKDNGFYKIPNLDETSFHFNYISDSLRYENIRFFISIDLDIEDPFKNFDKKAEKSLRTLIDWFFRKNSQNRSRVLGNSDNLNKLNKILSSEEVTIKFIDGIPLAEAYGLIEINSGTFTSELYQSLQSLKTANSYIQQISKHNDRDMEILGEIVNLCKIIRNTINAKDDDWSL